MKITIKADTHRDLIHALLEKAQEIERIESLSRHYIDDSVRRSLRENLDRVADSEATEQINSACDVLSKNAPFIESQKTFQQACENMLRNLAGLAKSAEEAAKRARPYMPSDDLIKKISKEISDKVRKEMAEAKLRVLREADMTAFKERGYRFISVIFDTDKEHYRRCAGYPRRYYYREDWSENLLKKGDFVCVPTRVGAVVGIVASVAPHVSGPFIPSIRVFGKVDYAAFLASEPLRLRILGEDRRGYRYPENDPSDDCPLFEPLRRSGEESGWLIPDTQTGRRTSEPTEGCVKASAIGETISQNLAMKQKLMSWKGDFDEILLILRSHPLVFATRRIENVLKKDHSV